MLAEIYSGALTGIEAYAVSIEVNAGHGEPRTVVVGLPDAAVKESTDRVWTALLHSGFEPPKGRTTINLAPANRRKEGPCFDLPIALGILAATDALRLEGLDRIDLQLEVPPVPFETLREMAPGECSAVIRARVVAARQRQRLRFERVQGVFCNAQMPSRLMASSGRSRRSACLLVMARPRTTSYSRTRACPSFSTPTHTHRPRSDGRWHAAMPPTHHLTACDGASCRGRRSQPTTPSPLPTLTRPPVSTLSRCAGTWRPATSAPSAAVRRATFQIGRRRCRPAATVATSSSA